MCLIEKLRAPKLSWPKLRKFGALWGNASGLALIEFAYSLPILMGIGMYGAEIANMAMVRMRINQVSMHMADNAARIGEGSLLADKKIYEADINDLFVGAHLQAGENLDIYSQGRIIVSSLQKHSDGDQYIFWQRCKGMKNHQSSYGSEGENAADRPINGMGPAGNRVTAPENEAVIFVEVEYDYQPLISKHFTRTSTIKTRAAFNVRDNRDLTQVYDKSGADPVASCDTYDGLS